MRWQILVFLACWVAGCAGPEHDADELALIDEMNTYRAGLGVGALVPDDCLAGAAHAQAAAIGAMQAYKPGLPSDHRGFGGSDVIDRTRERGCPAWAEISAIAADPVDVWKSSAGHDAIMRDPAFHLVGVGLVGGVAIAILAP